MKSWRKLTPVSHRGSDLNGFIRKHSTDLSKSRYSSYSRFLSGLAPKPIFLPSYTHFISSSAGWGSTQREQSAADGVWLQHGAAAGAALTTSACATSGTKEQLGSTHGVYSVVVFSHSSQTVAQIRVPDSPTQHDLLLDPPYFSTVNLGRKEQKLDAGTAHRRGTHLSLWGR